MGRRDFAKHRKLRLKLVAVRADGLLHRRPSAPRLPAGRQLADCERRTGHRLYHPSCHGRRSSGQCLAGQQHVADGCFLPRHAGPKRVSGCRQHCQSAGTPLSGLPTKGLLARPQHREHRRIALDLLANGQPPAARDGQGSLFAGGICTRCRSHLERQAAKDARCDVLRNAQATYNIIYVHARGGLSLAGATGHEEAHRRPPAARRGAFERRTSCRKESHTQP